jgi:hypothetical protein
MDGHSILKGDYPQVSPPKLRNLAPEPVSIALLWLRAKGLLHHAYAPLLSQVRALAQNLCLEILREAVFGHCAQDTDVRRGKPPLLRQHNQEVLKGLL